MTQPGRIISEQALALNMNEAAHALVRELSMAARKMGIYGAGHQLAIKGIEKPFFDFTRIVQYRPFIQIHVLRQGITLGGITLKASPFTEQMLQYLQALEVSSLVLFRELSFQQMVLLVESLLQRPGAHDPTWRLGDYLLKRGVKGVEVNGPIGLLLFEQRKQYRGEIDGDYSVRRLASDQIGSDPRRLALLSRTAPEQLVHAGFDFDADLLTYLLPERVPLAPIHAWGAAINDLRTMGTTDQATIDLESALHSLVPYHPQAKELGAVAGGTAPEGADSIRQGLLTQFKQLFESPDSEQVIFQRAADVSARLLKTGGQQELSDLIDQLLSRLTSGDPSQRATSVRLLLAVTSVLEPVYRLPFDRLQGETIRLIQTREEPYELTELLIALYDQLRRFRLWGQIASLVSAMATRRTVESRVTVYDSLAVKKAFEEFQRPERVDGLVSELIVAAHEQAGQIRAILVGLGSPSVASSLSGIISHPIRAIRQQALKVLGELGESSLLVFSDILYDDSRLERDSGRAELSDQAWYVIRNSIFVLGSLGLESAIPPLRLRISDSDHRVRREIIAALEKIGSEESIDLLSLLAEDSLADNRDAAIAAIGAIGSADAVPILINLVRRIGGTAERAIPVLGKLGGVQARGYLTSLLDDQIELARLAGATHASKDDLRASIVRALGQIGDSEAIAKVKELQQTLSSVGQFLFPNSPVRSAIADVLNRR